MAADQHRLVATGRAFRHEIEAVSTGEMRVHDQQIEYIDVERVACGVIGCDDGRGMTAERQHLAEVVSRVCLIINDENSSHRHYLCGDTGTMRACRRKPNGDQERLRPPDGLARHGIAPPNAQEEGLAAPSGAQQPDPPGRCS